MRFGPFPIVAALVVSAFGQVPTASAQPLGVYRWQLAPYCNVLTLNVTQIGGQYRLEGYDDQCGTSPRAPVTGYVVPNPGGTLEFGLTVVTTSGPQHVNVTFSIASLGGPWRDSGGNSGLLVFNPGVVSALPPRPSGLGAIAIDPDQVQARVSGACAAGEFIQSVAADGSVTCGTASEGGAITGVVAGPGLTGGGASGAVVLGVDTSAIQARVTGACGAGQYIQGIGADGTAACGTDAALALAGPGAAATAARSDHAHEINDSSTAVGLAALRDNTTGRANTAVGRDALRDNTTGGSNAAFGTLAMPRNTTGVNNAAFGAGALFANTSGFNNVAIGADAMVANLSGDSNTALGPIALSRLTTGSSNVASAALRRST